MRAIGSRSYRKSRHGLASMAALVLFTSCTGQGINKRQDGSAREAAEACWLARVEFKKMRGSGNEEKRMNCSLPLTALAKVAAPANSPI